MPDPLLPLADHPLIEAVPFFAPVLVIVLLLLAGVVRARRHGDEGPDGPERHA